MTEKVVESSYNMTLSDCDGLVDDLKEMVLVCQQFSQIIDAHLNDFITENLWETTIKQRALLGTMLPSVPDPSIAATDHNLTGTATEINHKKILVPDLASCCFSYERCCDFCSNGKNRKRDLVVTPSSSPKHNDGNTFLSEKKEHEVHALSTILKEISNHLECSKIVDFGSGKGYLCQHLAHRHGLDVLGIEMRSTCTSAAEKRLDKMKRATPKQNEPQRYKTATCTIDKNTLENSEMFLHFVDEQFSSENDKENFLLTGLHACGDLTSLAVQLFTKESCIRGLCVVGCCYNLLTTNGFPLCQVLRSINFQLGKQAKFLACQCPIKWKKTSQVLNKSLLYRAIFEKILVDKRINREEMNVHYRLVGKKATSFEDYMDGIRKQYKPLDDIVTHEEQTSYYENYSHQWCRLQEFHWLRMQLAPLLEKLVLLDRMQYMREQGLTQASIVRIFNPVLSPRCYAVVCTKE